MNAKQLENHVRFPNNVQPKKEIELNGEKHQLCRFRFRGIQDFYDFLKADPNINLKLWTRSNVSSITNDEDFAGVPYEKAIEKLVSTIDPGYQEFLSIQRKSRGRYGNSHEYQTIKSVAGGVPDPVAYATSSPFLYRTSRIIKQPKFLTIDIQLAFNCGTTKKQVFNRAVIITNLIKALEKVGYSVNVNSFMIAECEDEIIEAVFEIKKAGRTTNYQALYKSLVDVEFFRRLCFRIIEVSDISEHDWRYSYGHPGDEDIARPLLHLGKQDIYFDQPRNMGIGGSDIGEDFEDVMHELKLTDMIDVKAERDLLVKKVGLLKR